MMSQPRGDVTARLGQAVDALAVIGAGQEQGVALSPETMMTLTRFVALMRRGRQRHFPQSLFRDSAWDMMFELFLGRMEGRDVFVKELLLLSSEPSTNALRKIDTLQALDLIDRHPDPVDQRRVAVRLTEQGLSSVMGFLNDLMRRPPNRHRA